MNDETHIGLDVHQATIVVAVMDSTGLCVLRKLRLSYPLVLSTLANKTFGPYQAHRRPVHH